ncbi:putative transport-related inner membrane protein [Halobacteriovorax marinus SJ]|uniref:Transport-related inner membrane protein n=1 Tax=Halobacteriovorax marinus (strain ATCC BAA-682 / DSM 15412 / SJ) TaxID=862908 RepID=E1X429_HALMS|nr:mechanosensitive ion channel family protein [Halobacteriovorax marinus]CBW25369.1 putative transport-related inner membrane protein [Halobacteriovorax marinus SJ]
MKKINTENIYSILQEKVVSWIGSLLKILPNIIVAFSVILLFILLSHLVKKISTPLLRRFFKSRTVVDLIGTSIYLTILLVGVFISLEVLHLEKTVTSLLAGAGVIGLALGFAFQEIASNFVSGIFIAFKEPYQVGDIVEIDSYLGEVKKISLRTTSIMTFQGLEVLIPNKDMFTKPFINYSTTPTRRLDIKVGVSYSDDLELVTEVTKKALEEIDGRVETSEVEVHFEEFGDSSINLCAKVWIHFTKNYNFFNSRHQAILSIKKHYDENAITIPFPIRTIEMQGKS